MSGSPIGVGPPGRGGDLLADLRSGRIKGSDARLRAATTLLEGTFYQELFKVMRSTVPEGGVVPTHNGQEMFESLLDQQIADSAALAADRGLGQALYRYFTGGSPSVTATPATDPTPQDAG